MSREDPQFKLRMPHNLRAQAEQAARVSGRSLNAELVARLESSFLGDCANASFISADRAKELALMARDGIPIEIRKRAIEAIARAVRLGHRQATVGLDDLQLDVGISDKELDQLLAKVLTELHQAGYTVRCDDISSLWIEF